MLKNLINSLKPYEREILAAAALARDLAKTGCKQSETANLKGADKSQSSAASVNLKDAENSNRSANFNGAKNSSGSTDTARVPQEAQTQEQKSASMIEIYGEDAAEFIAFFFGTLIAGFAPVLLREPKFSGKFHLGGDVKIPNLAAAQNLDDRNKTVYVDSEHKMRDLIGFKYVKDEKTLTNQDFTGTGVRQFQDTTFFLQGKKPNGTSFTSKFKMTSDASINDLLEKIGTEYGNTPTNKVVEVTINNQGQINVKDLSKGNQVIDFHMIAATKKVANADALAGGIAGASSAFDTIDSLTSGANPLEAMVQANPDDYEITEFVKSKYEDLDGAVTNAYDYDKINLKQD